LHKELGRALTHGKLISKNMEDIYFQPINFRMLGIKARVFFTYSLYKAQ
jgi:hypothetical protein